MSSNRRSLPASSHSRRSTYNKAGPAPTVNRLSFLLADLSIAEVYHTLTPQYPDFILEGSQRNSCQWYTQTQSEVELPPSSIDEVLLAVNGEIASTSSVNSSPTPRTSRTESRISSFRSTSDTPRPEVEAEAGGNSLPSSNTSTRLSTSIRSTDLDFCSCIHPAASPSLAVGGERGQKRRNRKREWFRWRRDPSRT